MGSPNLSTASCNPATLPFPNNNTVIIPGICICFCMRIFLYISFKGKYKLILYTVYLCALFMSNSCAPFETWVIN